MDYTDYFEPIWIVSLSCTVYYILYTNSDGCGLSTTHKLLNSNVHEVYTHSSICININYLNHQRYLKSSCASMYGYVNDLHDQHK